MYKNENEVVEYDESKKQAHNFNLVHNIYFVKKFTK